MKNYRDKDWLGQKYWKEGLSQRDIAKLLNTSQSSVRLLMKKFNIKARRNHSEATKQKMRGARLKNNLGAIKKGENHHLWKGGSRAYYQRIAHRVWEEYWRQKVPEGYLLHHSDRDRRNKDICNLALLTRSFYMNLHRKEFAR